MRSELAVTLATKRHSAVLFLCHCVKFANAYETGRLREGDGAKSVVDKNLKEAVMKETIFNCV